MKAAKLEAMFGGRRALLTAFEWDALKAALAIPKGSTVTYSEIARAIGRPEACRAVANALAKNPFAPQIPCHRVIRGDGKPGGYSGRGGADAKLDILSRESIVADGPIPCKRR